jgi:uncharacterized membrane protein
MRIPLQVSAESMKNTDKSGSKLLGFVHFVEHSQYYIAYRVEQAVQQISVTAEIMTQFFGYCEYTMTVTTIHELE